MLLHDSHHPVDSMCPSSTVPTAEVSVLKSPMPGSKSASLFKNTEEEQEEGEQDQYASPRSVIDTIFHHRHCHHHCELHPNSLDGDDHHHHHDASDVFRLSPRTAVKTATPASEDGTSADCCSLSALSLINDLEEEVLLSSECCLPSSEGKRGQCTIINAGISSNNINNNTSSNDDEDEPLAVADIDEVLQDIDALQHQLDDELLTLLQTQTQIAQLRVNVLQCMLRANDQQQHDRCHGFNRHLEDRWNASSPSPLSSRSSSSLSSFGNDSDHSSSSSSTQSSSSSLPSCFASPRKKTIKKSVRFSLQRSF